ncbi:hypothetical protein FNW02_37520 [Komarekiella sp. 'clone 1']|uniref:Uncharacterized protein n=1 Tax=Komarekiella delphini-convector SJRDD-AB1 TaxID=2593771 RepID=A0AA40VVW8_9NOST|nr:hypothetical protein [Komarekiella delphini-convector]MBD6621242.1 hypothetical protein [Komarekiella delphini-convector SJRDD-AB1]
MTTKQIALLTSGFLALVAFGYFSTQIIGPVATSTIGFGGIVSGAVLEAKRHQPQQTKQEKNVPDL